MFRKRGLSTVVAVLILVLLTVVASGIVYTIAKTIIDQRQTQSENCGTDIIGKVSLNGKNTFLLDTNPAVNDVALYVGVDLGDVRIDKLFIVISKDVSGTIETKTIEVDGNKNYEYAKMYDVGSYNDALELPGENEGLTYEIYYYSVNQLTQESLFIDNDKAPKSIQIYPVINGQACAVSDKILEINTRAT